jgi:hypothetical protein
MVIDSNREFLLGRLLSDNVLIQVFLQLERPRELAGRAVALVMPVVLDDRIAHRDAFIADVGTRIVAGGRDKLPYNVLALVTERTAEGIVRSGALQAGSPNCGPGRCTRLANANQNSPELQAIQRVRSAAFIRWKIKRSLALIKVNTPSISAVFAPHNRKSARKHGFFLTPHRSQTGQGGRRNPLIFRGLFGAGMVGC